MPNANIQEEFLSRTILMTVVVYAQTPRTAKEIIDYSSCSRRAIEKWCDAGYLVRYRSIEPIVEPGADGGAPVHLTFKTSELIQFELLSLKQDLEQYS